MKLRSDIQIIELASNIYARLHDNMTNSGIIVGDNEVLVIDSLSMPSYAKDLISDVKYITDKPIKYLIDTHAHWDHSWGNEEFKDSIIIGHNNCYLEMMDTKWNENWRSKIINGNDPWAKEANLVNITPPTLTFDNKMSFYIGGRKIELLYFGKAHTSGDVFIHVPNEKILFTGDVIQRNKIPYLGDCYPLDWPDTNNKLSKIPIDIFVSGHGDNGNYNDLLESKKFIQDLVNYSSDALFEGQNIKEVTDTVINKLSNLYVNWVGFESLNEQLPDFILKLSI